MVNVEMGSIDYNGVQQQNRGRGDDPRRGVGGGVDRTPRGYAQLPQDTARMDSNGTGIGTTSSTLSSSQYSWCMMQMKIRLYHTAGLVLYHTVYSTYQSDIMGKLWMMK